MTEVAPNETTPAAIVLETSEPIAMRAMKLLRNYCPADKYEIVGWHRPERKTKDSAGRETVVQTAAFIEGEMAPPPAPGVGYKNKLWAGTVVRVPLDEAKRTQVLGIAERDLED